MSLLKKVFFTGSIYFSLTLFGGCFQPCPPLKDTFNNLDNAVVFTGQMSKTTDGLWAYNQQNDTVYTDSLIGFRIDITGKIIAEKCIPGIFSFNTAHATRAIDCLQNPPIQLNMLYRIEIYSLMPVTGTINSSSSVTDLFRCIDSTGKILQDAPLNFTTDTRSQLYILATKSTFNTLQQFRFKVIFTDSTVATADTKMIRIR